MDVGILEDWSDLTPMQKDLRLFEKQKATLDAFLARNAITKTDYTRSLETLEANLDARVAAYSVP